MTKNTASEHVTDSDLDPILHNNIDTESEIKTNNGVFINLYLDTVTDSKKCEYFY
jgi:hypothetical protein